jgi:mRNA-degrading endonuclease toxin of MazEF toxin-antitoxin module
MPANDSSVEGAQFPRRGEVWLLQNPITPGDPHLPRPVIIISTNPRNRTWDSVIVVPLSSGLQNPHSRFHKSIGAGNGGVDRDTHARCDLVSNIDKNCLDFRRGPLGAVSEKLMWDIIKGVRASIGDNPDL